MVAYLLNKVVSYYAFLTCQKIVPTWSHRKDQLSATMLHKLSFETPTLHTVQRFYNEMYTVLLITYVIVMLRNPMPDILINGGQSVLFSFFWTEKTH